MSFLLVQDCVVQSFAPEGRKTLERGKEASNSLGSLGKRVQNWELEEGISSISPSENSDFCMLQSFIVMPSAKNLNDSQVFVLYCHFANNKNTGSWFLSEVWKGNCISRIADTPPIHSSYVRVSALLLWHVPNHRAIFFLWQWERWRSGILFCCFWLDT